MPDAEELIDESAEGGLAARSGLDRSDCPHPPGTSLGNAWRRGYDLELKLAKKWGISPKI